ncbi:MAG: hypothetical protein EA420_01430, partial [Candidatus Competibacteraceae bacterium]
MIVVPSQSQTEAVERRVRYEPDELVDRLRILLADFMAPLGEHTMIAVLGDDLVDHLRRAEREIRARLEEEFTIVA